MTLQDYMTARDAAREIGIEYTTMLQRIRRGTVLTMKVGKRQHMVHVEEVERLKVEQTK